jgi:hypothetical protein
MPVDFPRISPKGSATLDTYSQVLSLQGGVRVSYGSYQLDAPCLVYKKEDAWVVAHTGDSQEPVSLLAGPVRILSPHLSYNWQTQQAQAKTFRLGYVSFYAQGENLSTQGQTLEASKAVVYLGEPDTWGVSLAAKSLSGNPSEALTLRHTTVRVGRLPVLYVPYWVFRPNNKGNLHTTASAGNQTQVGTFVQTTATVGLNKDLTLGGMAEVYSNAGWALGPLFSYTGQTRNSQGKGLYWKDTSARPLDLNRRRVPPNRYWVEVKHTERFGPQAAHPQALQSTQLKVHLHQLSDSELAQQIHPEWVLEKPYPESFIEATHTSNNTLLGAFVRLQPNGFLPTQKQLPELSLDYLPTGLGRSAFYHTGILRYSHIVQPQTDWPIRAPEATGPTHIPYVHAGRTRVGYRVARHFRGPKGIVHTTAHAGLGCTHYHAYGMQPSLAPANPGDTSGHGSLAYGELGLDVWAQLRCLYGLENSTWGVYGLRHTCTPLLQYRYVPATEQGNKALIAAIDADQLYGQLEPLDTLARPPTQSQHRLRLGLRNRLDTLQPSGYLTRSLLDADVYQDLFLGHKATGLGSTYTRVALRPAYWLQVSCATRWDAHRALGLQDNLVSVKICDGDAWSLAFHDYHVRHVLHQYGVSWAYRLGFRHTVRIGWRWDASTRTLVRQSYQLEVLTSSNWRVELGLERYRNTTRAANTRYTFQAVFLGF